QQLADQLTELVASTPRRLPLPSRLLSRLSGLKLSGADELAGRVLGRADDCAGAPLRVRLHFGDRGLCVRDDCTRLFAGLGQCALGVAHDRRLTLVASVRFGGLRATPLPGESASLAASIARRAITGTRRRDEEQKGDQTDGRTDAGYRRDHRRGRSQFDGESEQLIFLMVIRSPSIARKIARKLCSEPPVWKRAREAIRCAGTVGES